MSELFFERLAGRTVVADLLGGRLDSLSRLALLAAVFAVGGVLVGLVWGRITSPRRDGAERDGPSRAKGEP